MEPAIDIPMCPPPWDEPKDVVPMLLVIAGFVLAGWLFRRWKRTRKDRRSGP